METAFPAIVKLDILNLMLNKYFWISKKSNALIRVCKIATG